MRNPDTPEDFRAITAEFLNTESIGSRRNEFWHDPAMVDHSLSLSRAEESTDAGDDESVEVTLPSGEKVNLIGDAVEINKLRQAQDAAITAADGDDS